MNALLLIATVGTLTVAAGDGESPTDGRGPNLIANSDFSQPIAAPWKLEKGVVRKETEALSGDWTLSAIGRNYFIFDYLDDPNLDWKAGEPFTIVMDARSRGSGAKLYIVHRFDLPNGTLGEGTFRAVSLSDDWHEYYIPTFATKEGKPRGFSFFKVDSGTHDTGIEIRSFRMYRGTINSLDIRKVGRGGRACVQKGTEIPVGTNLYGTAAKPLRALAFVRDVMQMREVKHIFAGTGAKAHCVEAHTRETDTLVTDDDPKEVLRMLKAGEYDFFALGRGVAPNVGGEVFKYVEAGVRAGATIYFATEQMLHAGHRHRAANYGLFTNLVASAAQAGGTYGKGRVVAVPPKWVPEDVGKYHCWRAFMTYPNELTVRMGFEDFPYEQVMFTEEAERMYRRAFGGAERPADAVDVREETVYAGERHVLEWIRTAEGKTVSFAHRAEPLATASIGKVTDTDREILVAVSNATANAELKWTFSDFSGRIFDEGQVSVKGERRKDCVSLNVSREKLYTSFGLLKLELTDGPRILDRRNFAVIERDNDRLRMIGDYGAGFWTIEGDYTYQDAKDMFLQLKSCGFNYSWIPFAWGTVYSTGLAATSNYVIGGEYFSGSPTAKDNIRKPVFNTPRERKRIREMALEWSKDNRRWGGMYGSFSDEANLCPNGMEVDAHPENLRVYRFRMQDKYGTIAEYNRRHKTNHKSFDDLGQTLLKDARAKSNAAEFVEWRNFNVDRWVEVIREVGDAIKEVDPQVLYSLDNSFGEQALSGNDYWKLLTRTGLNYSKEYACCTYFSRGPLEEFDALYRSWRPDMRVWGWTGYGFTSDREKALPWLTALHRHGGFHWFAATCNGINLLDLVTGAKTTDAAECERSLKGSRMLLGLGKTLTDWEWAKSDIAIYYSHDSCLLGYFLGTETRVKEIAADSPYGKFQWSRRGAMSLLESTFHQYEFVSQEQVEKGFLDGGDWSVYGCGTVLKAQPPFKVLFMPRILAMSDREVKAVKAFLSRGGRVICDVLPGGYDELGVPRPVNPFQSLATPNAKPAILTVTGKNFDDLDPEQRAWVVKSLKQAGTTVTIESPTVVGNVGREGVHYRCGGADLYGVVRKPYHSAVVEEHDTKADELVFAKPGHVYDVRALRYLGFGDRVSASVPYAEAKLYAVLSAKIDGIRIEGKTSAADLDRKTRPTLSLDFQIESADLTPDYVLHVDVIPPSGKCPVHFQRNLATKVGRVHLDFPFALNDETGTWTVRVTEPLTGVAAERTFSVR